MSAVGEPGFDDDGDGDAMPASGLNRIEGAGDSLEPASSDWPPGRW